MKIKNKLVIDCETTGTTPGRHSMIEFAAVLYENGVATKTYHFHQAPTKSVSLGALKYNGMRIADFVKLQQQQMQAGTNFGGFIDFCFDLPKDTVVCGHNVAFDMNFLKAEADQFGIEDLTSVLPYKTLDTKVIAMFLEDAGIISPDNNSLSGLAEYLGIKYKSEALHGAMYDAELTGKVYSKLLELAKSLVPGDPLQK